MSLYNYFYKPKLIHKIIIFALLPLSFCYGLIASLKRKFSRFYDFNIPIISIGNLLAGGTGKTPFIISLTKSLESNGYSDIFIVSRGYKRESKGIVIVSQNGELKASVKQSGDEPYLIAKSAIKSSVIVSQNRIDGIKEAKKMGAKIILLDDGFRFNFKKLNIVLEPKIEPKYDFFLPSGLYRESKKNYNAKGVLTLKEGIHFKREVSIENKKNKMILISAIANPERLDEFLDSSKIVKKVFYSDHSSFSESVIQKLFLESKAESILVTTKDLVKMENFDLPFSVMKLNLVLDSSVVAKAMGYIELNKQK